MRKGLLTLGLAATLLSGSVFAEGPTISTIPTVVISDRTTDTNVFDGANGPSATSHLFRFTDGLDLAAYVDDVDTADTSLKFLFSEQLLPTDTVEVGSPTIAINGGSGVAYGPSKATIDGTGANVSVDPLDFRNIQHSPGTSAGPFSDPGAVADSRSIRLYVSDSTTGTSVAAGNFTVITTNATGSFDGGTGGPTSIFLGPEVTYNNFDGWEGFRLSGFETLDAGGDPNVVSTPIENPATSMSVSPTGTETVIPLGNGGTAILNDLSQSSNAASLNMTITGSGSTGLFGIWQSTTSTSQGGIATTAGQIWRIRWQVSSGTTTVGNNSTIRLRSGNTSDIGAFEDSYLGRSGSINANPEGPTTGNPIDHNTWFESKGAGTLHIFFDVYDFDASSSANFSLDSVSLNNTTRSIIEAAATKTVLVNYGNPSFTTFSGEGTPEASGVTNFPTPGIHVNALDFVAANRTMTITDGGTSISEALSARAGQDSGFTLFDFGTAGSPLYSEAAGNTLIVTDLWLHTSAAGNANAGVRFGVNTDATTVGFFSSVRVDGTANDLGVSTNGTNDAAFQTTSRRYTHMFEPQMGTGAVGYRFAANLLFLDSTAQLQSGAPTYSGTTTYDRLTVTRYSGLPSLD